jgi:hypothetical protein
LVIDSAIPSILVLTEDSGKDAFDTMRALVLAILQYIAPRAQLDRVEIAPTEEEHVLRSMRGNRWMDEKTSESHRDRTTLIQSIATTLGEGGFVIFHCDGDTSWKKRKDSTKQAKFDKLLEAGIRARLRDAVRLSPAKIDAAMKRVLLIVPHYSIESWLYQNTDEAIRLCHTHHGGKDVKQFEEWAADRKQLDEVTQPKDTVCLKDKYNLVLATKNFPFDYAVAVGKSLRQAVTHLRACSDLQAVLMTTVD